MRGVFLVAAALTCGIMFASAKVSAAPVSGVVAVPGYSLVTKADYDHHRHHYRHRRWDHGHWRFWD